MLRWLVRRRQIVVLSWWSGKLSNRYNTINVLYTRPQYIKKNIGHFVFDALTPNTCDKIAVDYIFNSLTLI